MEFIIYKHEGVHQDLKEILNKQGLDALINMLPEETESLEIFGYDNLSIGDNISRLVNLTCLAVDGVQSVSAEISKCSKLNLVRFSNSNAKIDMSPLALLPDLMVLNVDKTPNFYGFEDFATLSKLTGLDENTLRENLALIVKDSIKNKTPASEMNKKVNLALGLDENTKHVVISRNL